MPKFKKIKIITDACCKIPNANIKGRLNKGKATCAVILLDEDDNIIDQKSKYLGELTVPQAEYNGLIFGLDCASGQCRGQIEVWSDSEFVVRQLIGDYGIKSENMKPLFDEVKNLERRFEKVFYFHHRRETKWAQAADKLANQEYAKHN